MYFLFSPAILSYLETNCFLLWMELILPQLFIFVLAALVTQPFIIPNYLSNIESWFDASTALRGRCWIKSDVVVSF